MQWYRYLSLVFRMVAFAIHRFHRHYHILIPAHIYIYIYIYVPENHKFLVSVQALGVDSNGKKFRVTGSDEEKDLLRWCVDDDDSESFESAKSVARLPCCEVASDSWSAFEEPVSMNWKVVGSSGTDRPVSFCTSSRNSSGWILYTFGDFVWMTRSFAQPPVLVNCKPADLYADGLLAFTCTSTAPILSELLKLSVEIDRFTVLRWCLPRQCQIRTAVVYLKFL